ncbi:HD-GYP domain-containing protein [Limnoglobus roseus]|uniref:HD domain-containing protein n=1 Tax=Limnoglobus roseus TaxID=2598579 RepID=A0A5C1AFH3_9BACT|nr:HD domain-containing phosphohydrolase [Limnoglobus roseus]QEL18169.1 HD domain-containing protein [Limnoglobus roseus]
MSSESPASILVVDDSPVVSTFVRRLLEKEGYEVSVAADGAAALAAIAARGPELVVLDVDMPGLNGLEVCRRIKAAPVTRLLPVLILTGTDLENARVTAWEFGADEFLTKPFRSVELVSRCRSLIRQKRLVDERDSTESVMYAMVRAIEAKSGFTHAHSDRVGEYAITLATRLGLPETDRELLRRGAALHDVGKISTPDAILDKPGRLTPEEYAVVKQHTTEGARIVEPLRSARSLIPLIRWHHERMDGTGYPDGLPAGTLPLLVRVLAVADVYDALASVRPYRGAMSHDLCRSMMEKDAAGGGLDPDLVHTFFEVVANTLATSESLPKCVDVVPAARIEVGTSRSP